LPYGERKLFLLFKRYPDLLTHSAAIRLVAAVVVFIVFGSGIISTAIAYYEKRHLMEQAVEYTSSSSSLIRKSVNYQMLTRNPQAIQSTIENLVDGDNIKIIGIFDCKGSVAYSSRPKESEAGPGAHTRPCSGCVRSILRCLIVQTVTQTYLILKKRRQSTFPWSGF
jgi:hypothetical protein